MSFAGHVYDMIRRNKENRELLNRNRNRMKETRQKNLARNQVTCDPTVSIEEIERIHRETKQWKWQRHQRVYRSTLIVLGIVVVLVLGILAIILWVV